jgi:hypothetical protein
LPPRPVPPSPPHPSSCSPANAQDVCVVHAYCVLARVSIALCIFIYIMQCLPPISPKTKSSGALRRRRRRRRPAPYPPSRQVYDLPLFPFSPSRSNLFKLRKKTVSLFPLCSRNSRERGTDPLLGYVGYRGARDKVKHDTFGRFPPQKLYRQAGHTLLPRLNTERRVVRRPKREMRGFHNPFIKNNPSAETVFLVTRSKRFSP